MNEPKVVISLTRSQQRALVGLIMEHTTFKSASEEFVDCTNSPPVHVSRMELLDLISSTTTVESIKTISPPEDWKCETWTEALQRHRINTALRTSFVNQPNFNNNYGTEKIEMKIVTITLAIHESGSESAESSATFNHLFDSNQRADSFYKIMHDQTARAMQLAAIAVNPATPAETGETKSETTDPVPETVTLAQLTPAQQTALDELAMQHQAIQPLLDAQQNAQQTPQNAQQTPQEPAQGAAEPAQGVGTATPQEPAQGATEPAQGADVPEGESHLLRPPKFSTGM